MQIDGPNLLVLAPMHSSPRSGGHAMCKPRRERRQTFHERRPVTEGTLPTDSDSGGYKQAEAEVSTVAQRERAGDGFGERDGKGTAGAVATAASATVTAGLELE